MLLYADAERTTEGLHALATSVTSALEKAGKAAPKTRLGGVKAKARATVKTLQKYGGDYRKLTDLARMTFECATLPMVRDVLEEMSTQPGWKVSDPCP